MTITDEMIHKARQAWLDLDDSSEKCWRAALEAVAPMLIVHGMRAALAIMLNAPSPMEGAMQIDARAQELDPK